MSDDDGARSVYLGSRGIEIVRIPNELLARDSFMAEQVIDAAILRRMEELAP